MGANRKSYQQNQLMCVFSVHIFLVHRHRLFLFSPPFYPGFIHFTEQNELLIKQIIYCKRFSWDLSLFCCRISELGGLSDGFTEFSLFLHCTPLPSIVIFENFYLTMNCNCRLIITSVISEIYTFLSALSLN